MSSIIRDLKKIQRIISIVVRAAERCFQNAEVTYLECTYEKSEFTLKLNIDLFKFEYIEVEVSSDDANYCIEQFLRGIRMTMHRIIKELKDKEFEIKSDIKKYDQSFSDSPLLYLSSAVMFNQVINNIKL
jgi:hypothetical protein